MWFVEAKRGFSWLQRRRPFGWKHPKAILYWEKLVLGLEEEEEEEEEGDLKRRNGFHLHYSSLFLLFLIFFGCISPFHELLSFSRVFDVV